MNQLSLPKKRNILNQPYQAEVLANINLNGTDSNKETRHIFLLDDFSESYEPGDCIVALPQNDPELVEKLISMLGWDPQSGANDHGDIVPIAEALTSHFEFTKLTLPLLKMHIYFDNENYLNVFKMSHGANML